MPKYFRRISVLLVSAILLVTASCAGHVRVPAARIEIGGMVGSKPSISIPSGEAAPGFEVSTVIPGRGSEVRQGDYIKIQVTSQVWGARKTPVSTYDHASGGEVVRLDDSGELPASISRRLVGRRVGSRVMVVASPSELFGPGDSLPPGIAPSDKLLTIIDILRALHLAPKSDPAGAQEPAAPGLPYVKASPSKSPELIIPPGSREPRELRFQVLIQGHGATIRQGQTVIANYIGAAYSNSKVFGSSWANGKPIVFQIGTGMVIKGWDLALDGRRVGDRVLLSVPSVLAYGAEPPNATIPHDASLAFVVDVLGVL